MNIITGIVPVVPTVFTEDEDPDLEGRQRVIDFLVEAPAPPVRGPRICGGRQKRPAGDSSQGRG